MQVSPSRSSYVYSRSRVEQDTDPYSPVIVDDLLNGLNEWRNIQDIVRLTFKALSDVVKAQGTAIRELERQVTSKASKTEVNAGLSVKANVSDVSRSVAEVVTSLERKINLEDIQVLVEEKVSRSDLQYLLSSKVSTEELRALMDSKVNMREFESELHSLAVRVEDVQREVTQRVSTHSSSSQRDLQHLMELLDTKADAAEVKEALENKANKQSVANALHRKANKAEVDELLEHKADIAELKSFLALVDSKAERGYVDRLAETVESKVDRGELSHILTSELDQRPSRSDLDSLAISLSTYKSEGEKRLLNHMNEVETYWKQLRGELDRVQSSLLTTIGKKAEVKEVDRLTAILSKKADIDQVSAYISGMKQDIGDSSAAVKAAAGQDFKRLESQLLDFATRFDRSIQHLDSLCQSALSDLAHVQDDLHVQGDHQKTESEETLRFIQSSNASLRADVLGDLKTFRAGLEQANAQLEDLNRRKPDRKEVHEFRVSVSSLLDTKASKADVETALAAADDAIEKQLRLVQEDTRLLLSRMEKDISIQLEKKAAVSDFQSQMSDKVDNVSLSRVLSSRASLEDIAGLRSLLDQMSVDMRRYQSDFMSHVKVTQQSFEEVRKDVVPRGTLQELYSAMGGKASGEELRREIEALRHMMNLKVSIEELRVHIDEQQLINEAVCAETCVARWLWKSGDLRSGFSVPWEVQSINTCPENFIWDRDSPVVSTLTPGLYEVMVGFFARKRPAVQLLVNGEPLILANGAG